MSKRDVFAEDYAVVRLRAAMRAPGQPVGAAMSRRSVFTEDYAVVRLKATMHAAGRVRSRHGQHGALHCLPLAAALELIEAGHAKLPGDVPVAALRDAARAQRDAALAQFEEPLA